MLEYRSAANLAITLKDDDDTTPCEDLNFLGRAKCSHGAGSGPNHIEHFCQQYQAVLFDEVRLRCTKF